MGNRTRREGFELTIGAGATNAWRTKEFPSDKGDYELEVAHMFLRALDDDLAAQRTDNEPFDIEVVSVSRNIVVAGVQLVEAYDDARRARDAERRKAIERLCAEQEYAKVLDGWEIIIQTSTAIAQGAVLNSIDSQLAAIRALLTGVDWHHGEFATRDETTLVLGRRRGNAGTLRYLWRGGLLPIPSKSPFAKAAESKVRKRYSRSKTPAFWLVIYSLSLTPTLSDRQACGNLTMEDDIPFDNMFLFDVMGEAIYQPLLQCSLNERPEHPQRCTEFQLDPSSVNVDGCSDDFIEVRLFEGTHDSRRI